MSDLAEIQNNFFGAILGKLLKWQKAERFWVFDEEERED